MVRQGTQDAGWLMMFGSEKITPSRQVPRISAILRRLKYNISAERAP
jgi:hypothetical protein